MKIVYSIYHDNEPLFSIDGKNKVDIGTQIFSCIEYEIGNLEFEATVIKHQYDLIKDIFYCVCEIELFEGDEDYMLNQIRIYNKFIQDAKN